MRIVFAIPLLLDVLFCILKFVHNRLRVLEGLSGQQDMDYLAHLRIIIKEI